MTSPMTKSAQRKKYLACLKALSPADRDTFSRRALDRFVARDAYRNAATIMGYVSFGTEFPTNALLRRILADGKTLALPRAAANDMSMTVHAVKNIDTELEGHGLGFHQPKASCPLIDVAAVDIVVTPGVGFDSKGNRLGRGAGYYDRFLARPGLRAFVCALAFECQIADAIVSEAHDRPMDMILTEDKIIGRT